MSDVAVPAMGLLGIGVALPQTVRDNTFWEGRFEDEAQAEGQRSRDVLAIERSASGARNEMPPEIAEAMAALPDDGFRGAQRRRVVDDDAVSSGLEVQAGRRALEDAGVDPDEIDLVLTHSLLPDQLVPSNAPAIQDELGLRNAAGWSLDAGCASFQAQLMTAAALLRQGTFRRALIVQSHVASPVMEWSSRQSPNFGDAAAAAVVGEVAAGYGILGHYARTDGSFRDGIVMAPRVEDEPLRAWWTGRGDRFLLSSFAPDKGKLAGLRAGEFCREACFGALEDAGLTLDDIRLYIGNQSLGWFVDACRRSLGLAADRAFDTFADYANVGDAAILLNLHEARARGILCAGDALLLYSPSAGFTRTAVVYRWWEGLK